jgi:hypothetical protein
MFQAFIGETPMSRKPVSFEMAQKQRHSLLQSEHAKEVRGYALSEDDIHTMIPTLKVIANPDLLQYKTIDEALDDKGRLMILYLTESPSEGHWVCLLKRKSTLTYFDPYGQLKPDAESQWILRD